MNSAALFRAIGAIASTVMLTACAGAGQQPLTALPNTTGQSIYSRFPVLAGPVSPDAGHPLLYVSSESNPSKILVYKQDGLDQPPIRRISNGLSGPQGMTVTPNGDLWVADFTEKVLVFKRGASTAYKVLDDSGQSPTDVAVDTSGKAFVINAGTDRGGPGSISIYRPGHTRSSATLEIPGNKYLTSCAFDSAGNLFVAFGTSTGADIAEFVGGKSPAIDLHTTVLSRPLDIAFDNTGDALVPDSGVGYVEVFDFPNPALESQFSAGFPGSAAFASDFGHVFITDGLAPSIYELKYPSLTLVTKITKGFGQRASLFDVATDPPAQP